MMLLSVGPLVGLVRLHPGSSPGMIGLMLFDGVVHRFDGVVHRGIIAGATWSWS